MADETDREAQTPRDSGTLSRWKDFAERATILRDNAREAASGHPEGAGRYALIEGSPPPVRDRHGGLSDRKRQQTLERIARQSHALVMAFTSWENLDPGPELRRGAINELLSLRDEAKKLGIATD